MTEIFLAGVAVLLAIIIGIIVVYALIDGVKARKSFKAAPVVEQADNCGNLFMKSVTCQEPPDHIGLHRNGNLAWSGTKLYPKGVADDSTSENGRR